MSSVPLNARDAVRPKRGKRSVTYPYGDLRFPRVIETRARNKGSTANSAAFLKAYRDQQTFPCCLLISQESDPGDDNLEDVTDTYETLPGPVFVDITSYRDTGIPMLTAKQKVAATADFSEGEIVPAAINVAAIVDNGDGTVTVTLAGEHDLPPKAWVRFTGTNSTPTLGQQTSGGLTVGACYTISTFAAGDDFTNVGAASNASGVSFTATGTTPATYSHGSLLTRALRIVSVPSTTAVTVAGTLSGAGTAAGSMQALNRIVRELKPVPDNVNLLVKIDTMVAAPDVSVYDEDFKCWKDYDFPDFIKSLNFYNDLATTTGFSFNSHISWGGAVGLPMQDGYHGPCRARRRRFFFVGPPPDSFEEGLAPTFIMPSSGSFVIEGGSQSRIFTPDLINSTFSNSVSFRTGRIPHCLHDAGPRLVTYGAGQATVTVDMPNSLPARLLQGDVITLMGQPQKYDAGALWEVIVFLVDIPYTSGLPPNGFDYTVNPAVYASGGVIATNSPTFLGGSGSSFGVTPALPTGLSLNSSSGNITGTPASTTARRIYTVTCTVAGATHTALLDLAIT